ncbi:CPXCG motif-containing cysteine-rich protein [Permianibacter sp. IMCC34836]|uniref:CPXCG motif-containing cysteine-rich protein n=1 Tax=Permianibacter fluminis TaxID=2738515 RepID=UPI0015534DFC|nr:CPXCG motif-containing cysteine-rich protein [Permianibacter fluminis]NQD35958.1 CPXCG motif-containing cysteine-rich protein [Permianibacter fluminis]
MNGLHSSEQSCPYCGESIELLIDGSIAEQSYIEDCPVCCRPMIVEVRVPDGEFGDEEPPEVTLRSEDE